MFNMTRKLINLTASDVTIDDMGVLIIKASSYLDLDPIDYLKWARSEDIVTAFNSGSLALDDDGDVSTGIDAIRTIQKLFNLKLSESAVLAGQTIKEINLTGDYSLSISEGVATIDFAPNANSGHGAILQPVFFYDGGVGDKWLRYISSHTEESDISPFVMPYDSRLIGITFVNKKENTDADILVYRALKDNEDNWDLVYTYQIRNSRLALKTDILNGPTFGPGDKIAVFCAEVGAKPDTVAVTLYLIVTDDSGTDNVETYAI